MKKKYYCFILLSVLSIFFHSCDNPNPVSFKDERDGQVYKTVKIGKQIWMAENLRYLPSVVGPETESETSAYYYVYDYYGSDVTDAKVKSKFNTYGVLYNWPAAMNGEESSTRNPSRVQGVCPKGWHLPSNKEWSQLTTFLGGINVAGGKLKETGTTHWNSPNTGATDETGFKALPGGLRVFDGTMKHIGDYGLWWCATEVSETHALYWDMGSNYNYINNMDFIKNNGFSVRCVKD